MLTRSQQDLIRGRMAAFTGVTLPDTVTIAEGEGLSLRWDGSSGQIAAEDGTALARGIFLISNAIRHGEQMEARQHRHFRSCGAFIDCSRGAVPTLQSLMRYADHCAALGMNTLALYMEDTYPVPDYPYFGYLRGRYTQDELRALDDYCAGYGMELLPCIQTLAHLQHFLQWRASRGLADTDECLLAESEETYAFIRAAIASLRGCVRTHRLHIGMDEAHDVGLGQYLRLHGPTDRFRLLNQHLSRVTEICREQGFEPMMWSDMFFHLGSRTGDYYDPDCHIPQSVIDSLPQVTMTYWDYYHTDEAVYERMISEHARMNRPLVFAGGNWTWSGFLPHVRRTEATTLPAMRVCVRHGMDTVLATMWGDDGQETDVFLALSQLPLFSQACWLGEEMTLAHCRLLGQALTGLPEECSQAFGLFNEDAGPRYTGKSLIYGDLLLPVIPGQPDLADAVNRADKALSLLEAHGEREECRYAAALFRLMKEKAALIPAIRAAYSQRDKDALRELADRIPRVIALTEALRDVHRRRWLGLHKQAGWELFSLRYGALIGRLLEVRLLLEDFAAGALPAIEALESPELDAQRRCGYFWHGLTDPKYN